MKWQITFFFFLKIGADRYKLQRVQKNGRIYSQTG
jgi:hypothetical protein